MFFINKHVFVPTETSIILSVIGMIGLTATAVVLTYGFRRRPLTEEVSPPCNTIVPFDRYPCPF